MIAADHASSGISWHNQAENEDTEVVTGNYFQVLGLRPALGRLLTPQDDTAKNANPVAVFSYDYWKSRFAAHAMSSARPFSSTDTSFTIVGVAPHNFETAIGGYRPGLFVPISMSELIIPAFAPRDNLNSHQSVWLTLVGRLKPGVSREQAQAGLASFWHSVRTYELTLYKHHTPRFDKEFLDSQLKVLDDSAGFNPGRIDMKTPLIILMSMAGLLVAMCAINVATLLLLRAAARAREMSMRYALGAKRGRIVSQLLVEGGVLGVAGSRHRPGACACCRAVARSPYDRVRSRHRALFHVDRFARASLHSCRFNRRQPALQHCAGLPFSSPRSCPGAAPEHWHGHAALATLPQNRRRCADCAQRDAARRRRPVCAHAQSPSPSTGRL